MSKYLPLLSIILFCAFAYPEDDLKTIYEYSLTTLRQASAPYAVKIISGHNAEKHNVSLKTGVVFTYKGKNAKQVLIAGDFSSWRRVEMIKGTFGVWHYFLPEYDKKDIVRYKFFVDGIWVEDPMSDENSDDGNGALVSSTRSAATGENRFVSYRIVKENGKRFVEFRTYNAKASFISVAGDFNRWNPENDVMTRDNNSIWRIRKHLPKGKYRYTFIVDGEWNSDKFNPHNAADPTGKLCSLITIE